MPQFVYSQTKCVYHHLHLQNNMFLLGRLGVAVPTALLCTREHCRSGSLAVPSGHVATLWPAARARSPGSLPESLCIGCVSCVYPRQSFLCRVCIPENKVCVTKDQDGPDKSLHWMCHAALCCCESPQTRKNKQQPGVWSYAPILFRRRCLITVAWIKGNLPLNILHVLHQEIAENAPFQYVKLAYWITYHQYYTPPPAHVPTYTGDAADQARAQVPAPVRCAHGAPEEPTWRNVQMQKSCVGGHTGGEPLTGRNYEGKWEQPSAPPGSGWHENGQLPWEEPPPWTPPPDQSGLSGKNRNLQ